MRVKLDGVATIQDSNIVFGTANSTSMWDALKNFKIEPASDFFADCFGEDLEALDEVYKEQEAEANLMLANGSAVYMYSVEVDGKETDFLSLEEAKDFANKSLGDNLFVWINTYITDFEEFKFFVSCELISE